MSELLCGPVITGMRKESQVYGHVGDLLNAEHSIRIERFAGLRGIYRGSEKISDRLMTQKCEFSKLRLRELRKLGQEVLQIPVDLILPAQLGRHSSALSRALWLSKRWFTFRTRQSLYSCGGPTDSQWSFATVFARRFSHPASSRERRVATATACPISGARPCSPMSTPSAASVVPPGEVTFRRKVAASSGERCSSSPEPATVARASRAASSAGNPAAVPACASASASRNT